MTPWLLARSPSLQMSLPQALFLQLPQLDQHNTVSAAGWSLKDIRSGLLPSESSRFHSTAQLHKARGVIALQVL